MSSERLHRPSGDGAPVVMSEQPDETVASEQDVVEGEPGWDAGPDENDGQEVQPEGE